MTVRGEVCTLGRVTGAGKASQRKKKALREEGSRRVLETQRLCLSRLKQAECNVFGPLWLCTAEDGDRRWRRAGPSRPALHRRHCHNKQAGRPQMPSQDSPAEPPVTAAMSLPFSCMYLLSPNAVSWCYQQLRHAAECTHAAGHARHATERPGKYSKRISYLYFPMHRVSRLVPHAVLLLRFRGRRSCSFGHGARPWARRDRDERVDTGRRHRVCASSGPARREGSLRTAAAASPAAAAAAVEEEEEAGGWGCG